MKGNRIRYEDYSYRKGCKISTKTFTSQRTGARYRVVLDVENMQYFIRNENSKEFVKKSRVHRNMNVMKREAREQLEKLGVFFHKESRARTFGLCPKGYTQRTHERLKKEEKTE